MFGAAGTDALQARLQEVRVLPVLLGLLLKATFPGAENSGSQESLSQEDRPWH
jgi:hypothetical protein